MLKPGTGFQGQLVDGDGGEYVLPSSIGAFDMSPEAQARTMLEQRLYVVERTLDAMAAKKAAPKLIEQVECIDHERQPEPFGHA